MGHKIILIVFGVLLSAIVYGQTEEETIIQTFRHTRVINSHSTETLPARKLDFRVVHKFGDIAGNGGGWQTFYGLESASDISIGLEYGLTDNMMIGINRTKGAGPLKQNVNGLAKVRIMTQEYRGNIPLSLAIVGVASISTMPKNNIPGTINFFEVGNHRMAYHIGAHVARKFSDWLSIQGHAGWTYRNLVLSGDQNDLASVGGAVRLQMTKSIGFIFDGNFPVLSTLRTADNGYFPAIGIGFEFDTSGGHVFQVNLTNATGINETDFIPYTRSNWGDGQYRLGFTISRLFSM